MFKIYLFIFFIFICNNAYSSDIKGYVSLRSSEVNLRSGPSVDYPINFKYTLENYPVAIIGEYENWYKIRDKDGDEGWLNKNLTTKRRYVITLSNQQIMYERNNIKSRPLYILEKDVIGKLDKCIDEDWCKIEVEGRNGWLKREDIWGD